MRLTCFHCNKPLTITADQLGGEVVCPHCRGVIRLPEADAYEQQRRRSAPRVTGSWLSNSISGLASLAVHAALLVIFAVVTCDYRGNAGAEGEEVLIGELPVMNLNESSDEELEAEDAQSVTESSSELDDALEVVTPLASDEGEFSVDANLTDLAPSGAAGGGAPTISALSGGGGALGQGASFMGVRAQGTRFCIIADRSGSMDDRASRSSGTKLDYVKEEILETLSTMGSRGRFQLIFFNTRALSYPKPGWRHPRKDRADVAAWLQTVTAAGGTDPTPAFEEAFSLSPRPDAIFFMTDGLFPENVPDRVARMNRAGDKKVLIHAISFMDTSAKNLMQRIASDSGGRYRHVPGY